MCEELEPFLFLLCHSTNPCLLEQEEVVEGEGAAGRLSLVSRDNMGLAGWSVLKGKQWQEAQFAPKPFLFPSS